MIKSNISTKSNIYILQDTLRNDKAFLSQVRGRKALDYLLKYNILTRSSGFTEFQRDLYDNDLRCSKADEGDWPYGPVNKGNYMTWVCRCEKKECQRYSICRPEIQKCEEIIQEEKQEHLDQVKETQIIEQEKELVVPLEVIDFQGQQIDEMLDEVVAIEKDITMAISIEDQKQVIENLLEEAQNFPMIYKLTNREINQIAPKKNKVLIVGESEKLCKKISKYFYMNEVEHYFDQQIDYIPGWIHTLFKDYEEEEIDRNTFVQLYQENGGDDGDRIGLLFEKYAGHELVKVDEFFKILMEDSHFRKALRSLTTSKVEVVTLTNMHKQESQYRAIVLVLENEEVIEELSAETIMMLYQQCRDANTIYTTQCDNQVSSEQKDHFELQPQHIDWTSFDDEEIGTIIEECIAQGEPIQIQRTSTDSVQYEILYADLHIGKMSRQFTDDMIALWERVYEIKLQENKQLPMEVGGVFVDQIVTYMQVNKSKYHHWQGIMLQGNIEIMTRYN